MQSKYPNIIYRQGDLLSAYQDGITVIGHQCNCLGVWNGGLHRQIGRRFPEVIRQYVAHQWKLGDMRIFDTHIPNFRIAYLAGQYDYGNSQKTGKVYTRLPALCAAMEKLTKALSPADRLAFPLIGAGLAGGHWPDIVAAISRIFADREVVIYHLGDAPIQE